VFADYKTRGPVILKPSDTAELIEKLEDSQMQLGSMATNRYIGPTDECRVFISSVHVTCRYDQAFASWPSLGLCLLIICLAHLLMATAQTC
jgi:hypothetical protein